MNSLYIGVLLVEGSFFDMTCGECPKRIVRGYKDTETNCRYVRCGFKPEWRQTKNSSPKWCPLKNKKC